MLTPGTRHAFVISTNYGIVQYDMLISKLALLFVMCTSSLLAVYSSQWHVLVTATAIMLKCKQNCMQKVFCLTQAPAS